MRTGRSMHAHLTDCGSRVAALRTFRSKLFLRVSLPCPTMQAYSLRYAIYHLAHAIAAGQRQEQAQGRAPGAEAHTAEYQQQLDALLLDWGFWQQVG